MANDFAKVIERLVDTTYAFFDGTTVRPVTVRLICTLSLDLPLTPATINDFGVTTDTHYRALRAVLDAMDPVGLQQLGEELDCAIGDGPALTKLVQKYAPQYKDVRFETPWDDLRL
ncbi:MAG: hypothetical protein IT328_23760 [Caldilineaceae bacterium]|nr:hypothetical protein [Caldilineaceae bacterium]